MITAMVSFKVERGALERLAGELATIEEVVEVYSVAGEYDLVSIIKVRQYENLSDIVNDKIGVLEGVLDTHTLIAFKQFKFRQLEEGAPVTTGGPAATGTEGRGAVAPVLGKLADNFNLDRAEVFSIIQAIDQGKLSDAQIAGFLVGLTNKGPTAQEVAWIAEAMRAAAVHVPLNIGGDTTDTCGTGGGLTTFNVSTANAILAAAAGVPVAKHGSRLISSPSGSADVLEALGVNIEQTPEQAATLIEQVGISFIYAPNFHPIMGKVFGPENELGIKSIFFTIIGPLINPLGARNHSMGVYKPELVGMMASVVAQMDFNHVLVAHGLDGLDELSLLGKTSLADVKQGKITYSEISPEDFGLSRCTIDDIAGGPPERNAELIRGILSGQDTGPRRDFLTLNNAAALYVSGKADNLADGLALSRSLIDSGAGLAKLEELIKASQAV